MYDEKPMILKDEYVQIAILDERVRMAVRFDGDVYKRESLDSKHNSNLEILKQQTVQKRKAERKQKTNIYVSTLIHKNYTF